MLNERAPWVLIWLNPARRGRSSISKSRRMRRSPRSSSFTVREGSSHARTTMWLLERFLEARFSVAREGAFWLVRRD